MRILNLIPGLQHHIKLALKSWSHYEDKMYLQFLLKMLHKLQEHPLSKMRKKWKYKNAQKKISWFESSIASAVASLKTRKKRSKSQTLSKPHFLSTFLKKVSLNENVRESCVVSV